MTTAKTTQRRGRKRNRGPVGRRLRAVRHWIEDAGIRATVWLLHRIPYRWRVPFGGWVFANVIAPVAGYRRRIRANLDLVLPDLPAPEKARLVREVPRNIGRTVAELYSPDDFLAVAHATRITGPGLAALEGHGPKGARRSWYRGISAITTRSAPACCIAATASAGSTGR